MAFRLTRTIAATVAGLTLAIVPAAVAHAVPVEDATSTEVFLRLEQGHVRAF